MAWPNFWYNKPMKAKGNSAAANNKNILWFALVTAFILFIPLVAMQFTSEVAWSPSDFAVAGSLLFGTGLLYELLTRKTRNTTYKIVVGTTLLLVLLLVWVELAVGIFD